MTVTVSKSDYTIIKSVTDVILFLLYGIFTIIQSLIRSLIPRSYRKLKKISGEVVVITGGAGGLGKLLAIKLAKLKATVVLWDINPEGVEEAVKQVQTTGGKVYGYVVDLSNRDDVYRVAEKTTKEVGEVTILINNAGVVSGFELLETPDHLIERTFSVNIMAHFWTAKAFLPKMIKNNHGHIVTIASMAGHVGVYKLVDYCSSKFAAVGFDEALRVELEEKGIKGVHTTVICPYFIQSTGMFDDVRARFLPTLKSTDVADRIVDGLRRRELYVLIPSLFRYSLFLKWIFPWAIVSVILRNLVPDASPSTQPKTTPTIYPKISPNLIVENNLCSSEKQLS